MTMKARTLTVAIIAFSACATALAQTTYYVANAGDDGNPGSQAQPFETLAFSMTQLSSGDTLLLNRGDTWTTASEGAGEDGLLYVDVDGVTIGAYGAGSRPILDRSVDEDPFPDALFPDYTCIEVRTASNVTIQDLELRGGAETAALYLFGQGRAIVTNLYLRGAGWPDEALIVVRQAATFTGNYLDQWTGNSGGYGKGAEMRADEVHFYGNTLEGYNFGGGLRYANDSGNGIVDGNFFFRPDHRTGNAWAIVVRSQSESETTIFRNNVVDMTNGTGLSGSSLRGTSNFSDHGPAIRKTYNNTFICDGNGYAIHAGGSTNYYYNNIFYDCQTGVNNMPSNTEMRNNLCYSCGNFWVDGTPTVDSGNITSDPDLVDPTMGGGDGDPLDARIQADSPAEDAGYGADPDIGTEDYEGNDRTIGTVDIGAFELQNGAPGPSAAVLRRRRR